MSHYTENLEWTSHREISKAIARTREYSPIREITQYAISNHTFHEEMMKPINNSYKLKLEVASLLSRKLRVNSTQPFSLDPDVSKVVLYKADSTIPVGKTLQLSIVKSGEKTAKKKIADILEGGGKKALQQVTTPAEVYRPMPSFSNSIGTAAKMQLEKSPPPVQDIEKKFCIGINHLEDFENRDFTNLKWHVVYLPAFGIERTIEFVKLARNVASRQGVDFFKMIVISNSENATRINQSFGGTGVIVRHYTDSSSFSESLEKLDTELAKYEI